VTLEKLIEAGTFRKDLLFRLRSLTIQLPPLRARSGDIYEILMHYIQLLGRKYTSGQKGFSPEFLESVMQYSWPGNVREFIHAVESALSDSCDEPTLFRIHLPNYIRSQLAKTSVKKVECKRCDHDEVYKSSPNISTLKELIDSTEKRYFEGLIKNTGGDIKEISRISRLSRSKVYDRFKKYGLSKYQ